MLLPIGVLLSYLDFLVRLCIAKCFTNSSRQFWCEIMFHDSACSACEYTMFTPAQLFYSWHGQWPSSQGDLDLSVTREMERVYYTEVGLLLISCLYCSTWLLLGCICFPQTLRKTRNTSIRTGDILTQAFPDYEAGLSTTWLQCLGWRNGKLM
jgi:hypothetical protein